MNPSATIVACLTPPGTGAIATLAIRGPEAWTAIGASFEPTSKRPLPEIPPIGSVWFGRLGDDDLADEVVLTVKQTEPTWWLEVHAHGGQQVVAWLLESIQRRGIQPRSWSDFLAEVEPPARSQALRLLARTSTVRTAAILLDQANGAFRAAIEQIRGCWESNRLDAALARIDDLLRFERLGARLTQPWRVVAAGAPNAGKSSLVNALAGFQRSVVAPLPGTTRDVVSTRLAIDGWPVELLDTAGIRAEALGIERAGIDAARAVVESADLCLWIVDAAADSPVWPENMTTPIHVVLNKCDLSHESVEDPRVDVRVSAATGAGIGSLLAGISRKLVSNSPTPGAAVPFFESQNDWLRTLRAAIASGERDIVHRTLTQLEN